MMVGRVRGGAYGVALWDESREGQTIVGQVTSRGGRRWWWNVVEVRLVKYLSESLTYV